MLNSFEPFSIEYERQDLKSLVSMNFSYKRGRKRQTLREVRHRDERNFMRWRLMIWNGKDKFKISRTSIKGTLCLIPQRISDSYSSYAWLSDSMKLRLVLIWILINSLEDLEIKIELRREVTKKASDWWIRSFGKQL